MCEFILLSCLSAKCTGSLLVCVCVCVCVCVHVCACDCVCHMPTQTYT